MIEAREDVRRLARAGVPLGIKLLYTLFVAVLVPTFWAHYSPANFLWFCDVALLMTLAGLWLESRLLASMQALAMTLPQAIWGLDFLVRLTTGIRTFGFSDYMFNPTIALFIRALSLYHLWLPFLLLWLVWRLGYDRRALAAQTIFGSMILLLSYLLTENVYGPAGNVNLVHGPSLREAQVWMAPWLWLGVVIILCPTGIYAPTHLVLCRLMSPRNAAGGSRR